MVQETTLDISSEYKKASERLIEAAEKLKLAKTRSEVTRKSNAYTQSSIRLFGLPDVSLATRLFGLQRARFESTNLDDALYANLNMYFRKYNATSVNNEIVSDNLIKVADLVKEYLDCKYGFVLKKAEGIAPLWLKPQDVFRGYEMLLEDIQSNFAGEWNRWKVKIEKTSSAISVNAQDRLIKVGLGRAAMHKKEFTGNVAHELLGHVVRSVNGASISEECRVGLPNYLVFEEGLSMLKEFSVCGYLPDRIVDRYVDVALALGIIDGVQKPRAEILEFVYSRELVRNSLLPASEKMTTEDLAKKVIAHTNRVFRGVNGQKHVGIYTKDIVYLSGFIKASSYIEKKLAKGLSIEQIMDFVDCAKFDPTLPSHLKKVEALTRYS